MDWDDFHRRAKRVVPQQELKARRCWIGVLDHRKSTQDDFKETDFLWMIGHNVSSIAFPVSRQRCFGGVNARGIYLECADAVPRPSADLLLENSYQ